MLATIWSQVDTLLNKNKDTKPASIHFCRECSGVKVISPEGLPVCSECGLVEDNFVDDTAEWTSGMTSDGRVNDPSRCAIPNANADLFSDKWGKWTIINGKATYEHKRMAKINFHMSMNHKDRSLYHAYRDIDEACHTLPECVRKDAKHMYKKFNGGEAHARRDSARDQSQLRFVRV